MGQCLSDQSNVHVPSRSTLSTVPQVVSPPTFDPRILAIIVPSLENYDSNRESPQAFCRRIEVQLRICGEDVAQSKEIIVSKLTDSDRIKVEKIPESVRIGNDTPLHFFHDALCRALISKKESMLAYNDMLTVNQSTSNVDQYASKIRYLYERAYPGIGDEECEDTLMSVFMKGVNTSIAHRLESLRQFPESFNEIVTVARRIEMIERERRDEEDEEDELIVGVNAISMASVIKKRDDRTRNRAGKFTSEESISNSTTCYFSTTRTKFKIAEGYLLECEGELTKLSAVNAQVQLYGAEDVLDLLILRGSGEEIDWMNKSEAFQMKENHICKLHLEKLLLNWKTDYVFNKKNKRKEATCSLPNIVHQTGIRPIANRRLKKEEALRLMENTEILCHVGTAICTTHFKAIDENRFSDILFEDKYDHIPMAVDVRSPRSGSIESRGSSFEVNNDASCKEDELKKKVQEITHAFGLNRIASDLEWDKLKDSVQEKKINSMVHLIDGVCVVAAGSSWMDFRSRCVNKMIPPAQDNRVEEIMSTISSSLEDCPMRTVRNRILSLVTGVFSEREIIHYTGCTSYDIRQSKLSAKGGFADLKVPFHRIRINRPVLKEFVAFIALPEITIYMPSAGKKYMLETGESVELAKVVRVFSYREIHRRYLRHIEEKAARSLNSEEQVNNFVKENTIGFTTAHKLMEILAPSRRKRLQCVDNHQADSMEAFEYLNQFANELAAMEKIDNSTRSDLLRRSRVSSNFISYEQRVHMEKESSTVNHCIRYLLSDRQNKEFASPCHLGPRPHTHDSVCKECLECADIFDIFLEILEKLYVESQKNKEPESIRIHRMIEQMKISKDDVKVYRKHQIRSFASEMNRKEILDNLKPREALIVLDFALKILPTTSVEVQSQWYAKAGIAYHMGYCVANFDEELYAHAFGHSADDLSPFIFFQDFISTSAITEDILKQLKDNGVERVYVRSDNAGNYHNAAYLSSLYYFAESIGVRVIAYVFSEAQSGKGDADREISHSKRKMREHVDGKGNIRNAADVVGAVTSGTLLKESGIRARKFDQIGKGVLFERKKIIKNEYSYSLGKQGGYLSKSNGFWKKLNCGEDKKVTNQEMTEEDSTEHQKEGIFFCTDRLCTAQFLEIEGLMEHQFRGVHRRRKNSESTVDTAVRLFADAVQTDTAAAQSVKSDSLVSFAPNMLGLPEQGWGMQKPEKARAMKEEMRDTITEYFHERRNDDRRAVAREIAISVRDMKKTNGHYRFDLIDCPKESQCQSLISSLLREKASNSSAKKTSRKRRANDENESSEDDSLQLKNKRGRKSVKKEGEEKASSEKSKHNQSVEKKNIAHKRKD